MPPNSERSPMNDLRRITLVERRGSMQIKRIPRSLFSVLGQTLAGSATALIIADNDADAECFAVPELGFVTLSATALVSDSVYVGS
jgi:hypothetical protein